MVRATLAARSKSMGRRVLTVPAGGARPPDAAPEVTHPDVLLKTGALQSAIFNSTNFSSIATDAKEVIQIFNVGAERMLGDTAAEVMNKITPADISDPQEVIARAKALSVELGKPIAPGFEALVFKAPRGIEDIYELTYFRKDGSRFPAVVSVTALRDAQEVIIGYLLIGTDDTTGKQIEEERQKLDQRLRDQHFYTRSLIESNIDALMAIDPRGIITDVNKQTEALTGSTRDELIGAPFKNYFTDAAVRVAEQFGERIDLLLSDLIMPQSEGPPLLERLAAARPDLRVLYISGYADEAVVRHGVIVEGTPFLQKPFTPLALCGKVREVLDDPRTTSERMTGRASGSGQKRHLSSWVLQ